MEDLGWVARRLKRIAFPDHRKKKQNEKKAEEFGGGAFLK
jgi:hypothetical protein